LRQAAGRLLAVPILITAYLGTLLQRSTLARVGLALGLSVALGIGAIGAGEPAVTVATPPSPIVPLTRAAFTTTFSTAHGLADPVTIAFSTPMDAASVGAAVQVEPATPVALTWDDSGTRLTISPQTRWSAGTYHTVTVRVGALARSGEPLTRPARAVFVTRHATTGSVVATAPSGARVSIGTSFRVSFANPVDTSTVDTAIRLDPPAAGIVRWSSPTEGPARFTFEPSAPLLPDVHYRVIVAGVRDLDGVPLDPITLSVWTTSGPTVVRFRPRAETQGVARDTAISVRFSQPMERRSTTRSFSVSVGGTTIAGSVRWAERDTVLVFTPTVPLPYGITVAMDVAIGATSIAGEPLAAPEHGSFETIAKPVAPRTVSAPASDSGTSSGGGAVGGGSWGAVESYYLGLMNCTRTGGWVTSTGSCSSPGGRAVAALKLDSGISSKVSRPYAKILAVGADCSHFIGGGPADRLRRAGYPSYHWAENLGCRSGDPYAAVLSSHLFFQSEKSTGGGHYVNLMNAQYDRVGIGVWVYGGRVRLVVDFYHP